MEGGRPQPSGSAPAAPWRRWTKRLLVTAAVLVLLCVTLVPLLLRGPVLRWVVARATRPLCGWFGLEGGRVSWMIVPDVLLGRAVAVELRGVRIGAPDGSEVLSAREITADVEVARGPWRFAITRARVGHGSWKLAVGRGVGAGFLDAFRSIPSGATRDACGAGAPRAPRTGPRAPSFGGSLVVRDVRLDEVDVDLDFPTWGLTLPRVRATGSLGLGVAGSGGLLFEALGATAPGGVLRLGRDGARGVTRARFDDVAIERVAVSLDRPTDLVLTVRRAATGRSDLSGTAVFEHIFPPPGPRRRGPRPPAGITLEARWERLGDARARVEAGWLPAPGSFAGKLWSGIDGDLRMTLHGPFQALSGEVSATGPGVRFQAALAHGTDATADLHVDGFDTATIVDVTLQPLLGGSLTGHLSAELNLGSRGAGLDAAVGDSELVLRRAPGGPGPRRIRLRVGGGASGVRPPPLSAADSLELGLGAARFDHDTLRVTGLHAGWAGVRLRAGGTMAFADDERAAPPHVDGKLDVGISSLARWVPTATADARLTLSLTVGGPLDRLSLRGRFAPSSNLSIRGERFRAPPLATATVEGGAVIVFPGLTLTHEGGGAITARGRVVASGGGAVAGRVRVDDYPLARLPGLDQLTLPRAILPLRQDETAPSLARALRGTLNATLEVHGALARPDVSGTVTVTDVALADRRLGDGQFTVRARPDRFDVDGTLGASLSARGWASGRGGLTAGATIEMRALALGPWLPPPLTGMELAASGEAHVSVTPHQPVRSRAQVRLEGSGNQLDVRAAGADTTLSGGLRGIVEVAGWRALWSPWLDDARGTVDVDLNLAAPRTITGTARTARPLVLRPRGWPVALEIAEGGRVDVDGLHLHTPGLSVAADGNTMHIEGDATVDPRAPASSTVALVATARLDAAAVARHLPQLGSASGTVTLDTRVSGAAAAPSVTGSARLERVQLRPKGAGWPALSVDGEIQARGHTLSTRGLRVQTRTTPAGTPGVLTLGRADQPATVDIVSLQPLRLGEIDVPLAGNGLRIGDGSTALAIADLDLALRLRGHVDGELVLAGDVGIAGATFDPGRGPAAKPGPSRPWYQSLPPHLTLDLTLHGPDKAVAVAVPVLPDVSLSFECRVHASTAGGALSGRLRGSGVYSRMALAVYDWFTPRNIRACQLFKER
jgi:hypothetical protein